jgi:hypothetical protein
MDRITVNEFIEELRNDYSPLKDGHDLGLIIDDTNGDSLAMKRLLATLKSRATCCETQIEELSDPLALQNKLSQLNSEEVLVLVHADSALLPRHHAALQSLVHNNALQAWNYQATSGHRVSFGERCRFVLVISRQALETSWGTHPLLKGIVGATISCDGTRKEAV